MWQYTVPVLYHNACGWEFNAGSILRQSDISPLKQKLGKQSKLRNQELKFISLLTKEADVTTEGGSVLASNTA
jgi:hypothetical protein